MAKKNFYTKCENANFAKILAEKGLSLIHISEPTRPY